MRLASLALNGQSHRLVWAVCESSDRWIVAVRRFASELVPSHIQVDIESVDVIDSSATKLGRGKDIVLWEVSAGNALQRLDQIGNLAASRPKSIQIAAVTGQPQVGSLAMAALRELGAAVTIGEPEDLLSLQRLFHRSFDRLHADAAGFQIPASL